MVTINDSTLRANVFETIYDLLDAANLDSSQVTVTSAYIDDTQAFPQVVVNPIMKRETDFTVDTTRTSSSKTILIDIDIYTKGTTSTKDRDTIADEVDALIRSTIISGVMLIDSESNPGFITPNDNKVKMNTLTFTFLRR